MLTVLAQKKLALGFIVLYALFALTVYAFSGLPLYDYLVYIIVVLLVVFYSKSIQLPALTIILLGLSVVPHSVGMIPLEVNGEQVSLYHDMFFNGNYDLFTHFVGLFLFTIGLLHFFASNYPKTGGLLWVVLFLAMMGVGTCIEIFEFLGYQFFGFGWGAFAFGAGDNSANFGPWGDSMTDTLANLAGITIGFVCYFLLRRFFK